MESNKRACIINAAIGGWYPRGQQRLKESLNLHGFSYDFLGWNGWPNDNFDKSCPYNIKAAAFEEAIKAGYTHILWLDCSVWAIKDPNPIFDVINEEGYYVGRSGFNCAQCCSDICLNYFGIDRDTAEGYHDCSSGILGVNLEHEQGSEFINRWLQAAKDKVFHGSRFHDNQSQDKRFLFHRQDQSAASIIMGQMGLKMYDPGIYAMYYQDSGIPESVIFLLRGM
jgi:hypothetical protein